MSYANNPTSILAGTGITVTPTTATGATTVTISATGPDILTVRLAVATPDTLLTTDEVVSVEVPGSVAVAVTLPAGVTGQVFYIKDGLGLAAPATPITITPTAGTIDGSATATIDAPYGALTLVYSGVEWKIL
jgi:hypothetical protein